MHPLIAHLLAVHAATKEPLPPKVAELVGGLFIAACIALVIFLAKLVTGGSANRGN